MSGHSKWSTIKRKKEVTDALRGKLFSKLSKAISTAVKVGGGPNPDTNAKLRVVIEEARAANMPRADVEKDPKKKKKGGGAIEEFTYEGFGPGGMAVIIEGATDNRNRTGQEIKGIFERGGGRLAGPGAVSFNFKPKSMFLIAKKDNKDDQILQLIDLGVEDVEETDDGIEVFMGQEKFSETKEMLESKNHMVIKSELVRRPINYHLIDNVDEAKRALSFLEKLEDNDDVHKVFASIDIPDSVL